MFKWLRNLRRQPTWEEYNKHAEEHRQPKVEEDVNAIRQNTEELEFNENNPVYDKRIYNAKTNLMRNMSEEKKHDLLQNIYIDEAMDKEFKGEFDREHEV